MKRKINWLICLLLITTILAVPVMAVNSVSVSLSASKTTVNSGDNITITVSATVDSCGQGSIEVSYDSKVFELVSGECVLGGTDISYFDSSSKDGGFAFEKATAVSGNVFSFVLKIKDGASVGSSGVTVHFTADSKTVSKSVSITVACAHTYNNSCDTTCNSCGATRNISHSWNSGTVTKAATCTAAGSKKYTCKVCGETKTETVSKTAHTYDNGCDAACNVCGGTRSITHAYTWTLEGTGHIQKCTTCGATQNQGAHTPESTTSGDATGHGFKCTVCGLIPDAKAHEYDNDCDTTCNSCGYTRAVTHAYSGKWSYGATGHWYECMICGEKMETVAHTPGEAATETTDQTCLDCGYIIQPAGNHVHTMAGDWKSNDVGHWFLCACLSYTEPENHTFDEGTVDAAAGTVSYRCTVCGHAVTEALVVETEPAPTVQEPTGEDENPGTVSLQPGTALLIAVLILVAGFGLGIIIGRISRT